MVLTGRIWLAVAAFCCCLCCHAGSPSVTRRLHRVRRVPDNQTGDAEKAKKSAVLSAVRVEAKYFDNRTDTYFINQCLGSILDDYHVLTSANCNFNSDHQLIKLTIRGRNFCVAVMQILVHHRYPDTKDAAHDLALLRTAKMQLAVRVFNSGEWHMAVKLPSNKARRLRWPRVGQICHSVCRNWLRMLPVLHEIEIVKLKECASFFDFSRVPLRALEDVLCVRSVGDRVCDVNGGAGVICSSDDSSDVPYLAGVINGRFQKPRVHHSGADSVEFGENKTLLAVRVSTHENWISRNVHSPMEDWTEVDAGLKTHNCDWVTEETDV